MLFLNLALMFEECLVLSCEEGSGKAGGVKFLVLKVVFCLCVTSLPSGDLLFLCFGGFALDVVGLSLESD